MQEELFGEVFAIYDIPLTNVDCRGFMFCVCWCLMTPSAQIDYIVL